MSDRKDLVLEDSPILHGDIQAVPSIYIDGMQGAINTSGIVKLNLYQYAQDLSNSADGEVKKLLVGRLVLSEATLVGVNAWLTGMVQDAKGNGEDCGVPLLFWCAAKIRHKRNTQENLSARRASCYD